MEDSFVASQVAKIIGVTMDRLEQWIARGYVSPSIQKAKGQGTRNIFGRGDLYKISLFKRLVESGFNRTTSLEYFNLLSQSTETKEKSITGFMQAIFDDSGNFITYEVPITEYDGQYHRGPLILFKIDEALKKGYKYIVIIKELFEVPDEGIRDNHNKVLLEPGKKASRLYGELKKKIEIKLSNNQMLTLIINLLAIKEDVDKRIE